jgi:hypothetical protein
LKQSLAHASAAEGRLPLSSSAKEEGVAMKSNRASICSTDLMLVLHKWASCQVVQRTAASLIRYSAAAGDEVAMEKRQSLPFGESRDIESFVAQMSHRARKRPSWLIGQPAHRIGDSVRHFFVSLPAIECIAITSC